MNDRTFNAKPTSESTNETFVVKNWPETPEEAIKAWGAKRVQFCIDGTSAQVQAQGKYRTLRTRKEDPLTAQKAALEMAGYKPSDGARERLTAGEKMKRQAQAVPLAERITAFIEMGLTKDEATKAATRLEAKE